MQEGAAGITVPKFKKFKSTHSAKATKRVQVGGGIRQNLKKRGLSNIGVSIQNGGGLGTLSQLSSFSISV